MKKILLFLMALVSLQGRAQLSEIATFDFQDPTALTPSVTPSTTDGSYVIITSNSFTNEKITLSFGANNLYGIAELYTRVISGYPTQYYIGFSTNATMKITAQEGSFINSIVFEGTTRDLLVNEGTYNPETRTWTAASSSGSPEVIFSNPKTAEPSIYKITVNYTAPSEIMVPSTVEVVDKDDVAVAVSNTTTEEEVEVETKSFKSLDITYPNAITALNLAAITMTDKDNNPVAITPTCTDNVLSIVVNETIVEDGDFVLAVPQRVVQYGDIQNKTLPTYKIKVHKDRAIYNPVTVDPAEGELTELPETIKLTFEGDVMLADYNSSDIIIKKRGTPIYAATLSVDETDQTTVLLKSSHSGNISNSEDNLGEWTIEIPAEIIHNPFKGNATYDLWNKALTLTYTLIETPDPLKDQKDVVKALKEKAAALIALIGTVGYPKADDATSPLATAINFEITETTTAEELATYKNNLETAIKAFYNNPIVTLPAGQKWYTIASVNSENKEVPLSYTSGAVALGGTATAFQVESITSDGVAVLKVKAGKNSEGQTVYKYLHVLLGTDDYDLTSSKNVTDEIKWFSSLTIGKMLLAGDGVDQKPVAGLLTIKGGVGNDKVSGNKAGDAFAMVTHGATPAISTSLTVTTLQFTETDTHAFRFVETTEPSDEPVTPPVTPTYSLTEVNTADHTMILTIGDVTSATLSDASKVKVKNGETDVTSQVTATTLIEALTGSNYQFTVHVDGLAAGTYTLSIEKGAFTFADSNVDDNGENLSFTIPDPTPTTPAFTKTLEFYNWPINSGEDPLFQTDLNDFNIFIYKGAKYSDLCVDETKIVRLLNAENDAVEYRQGKLVENPDFVLPEEWGGADPSIKAYRVKWDTDIKQGDLDKVTMVRIVFAEATFGDEHFGAWLQNHSSVEESSCIVNARWTRAYSVTSKTPDQAAFENYKKEQKTAADGKAQEGDSEACAKLITDAKAAIDALEYDATKSLDDNKALVDAIITELDSKLDAQRAKDAFASYKTEQQTAADGKAAEGDSEACAKLITDAKAAIGALEYDATKSLAENKALVDAIISKLDTDLAAQRALDASKAALEKSIADATTYYDSIKDQYAGIANTLNSAIDAAKAVLNDATSTKSALDAAKETLEAAVETAKDAVATGISAIEVDGTLESVYTINGQKLNGKPTAKGLYIINGKKVVIK